MKSVLEEYFLSKRKRIYKYANIISRMFYSDENIEVDNKTLRKIINIYITENYKIINPSLKYVLKYYDFEENIDVEYRCIMDAVVKYYEDIETIENNPKVFYMSYLVYFAVLIDKLKDTILIMPNKSDFIISIANKVSDKLKYEKNDEFKKSTDEIVTLIKQNIKTHNKLKNSLKRFVNKDFYNNYILLNSEYNLYKIAPASNIKGLSKYKEKDIKKIYTKENVEDKLKLMSYEYSQIMLLKCLLNDQRNTIALDVNKDFYKKKSNINALLKLVCNSYTVDYTKVLINLNEYEECEEIDRLKQSGIKIIIESYDIEKILNTNFDEYMVLLTSLDVINENKIELENRNIKYIKKIEEKIVKENELFISNLNGGNNG